MTICKWARLGSTESQFIDPQLPSGDWWALLTHCWWNLGEEKLMGHKLEYPRPRVICAHWQQFLDRENVFRKLLYHSGDHPPPPYFSYLLSLLRTVEGSSTIHSGRVIRRYALVFYDKVFVFCVHAQARSHKPGRFINLLLMPILGARRFESSQRYLLLYKPSKPVWKTQEERIYIYILWPSYSFWQHPVSQINCPFNHNAL